MSSLQIGRTCRQPTDHVCALRMFLETELRSKNVQMTAHPSPTCLWFRRSAKPSLGLSSIQIYVSCSIELVGGIFSWGVKKKLFEWNLFLNLSLLETEGKLLKGNWREPAGKTRWAARWEAAVLHRVLAWLPPAPRSPWGEDISLSQPGSVAAAHCFPRDWCPQEVRG